MKPFSLFIVWSGSFRSCVLTDGSCQRQNRFILPSFRTCNKYFPCLMSFFFLVFLNLRIINFISLFRILIEFKKSCFSTHKNIINSFIIQKGSQIWNSFQRTKDKSIFYSQSNLYEWSIDVWCWLINLFYLEVLW